MLHLVTRYCRDMGPGRMLRFWQYSLAYSLKTTPPPSTMRLQSIGVVPEARGRGIAREMLRSLETSCRRAGCRFIQLEVEEDNLAARALYLRMGYREVKAVTLLGEAACIMRLRL
jgi:ribosomal protein S18 acetylase RimI-like enzyme